MQNMDFYSRKMEKNFPPQFDAQDPEYFSRIGDSYHNEMERSKKNASMMTALIIALCIISFTTGLVVGLKFAGGKQNEIVDEHTRKTMSNIGKKMTSLVSENANAKTAATGAKKNLFPREEYPYVIKIGNEFDVTKSQEIAGLLSSKGHTVILSKYKENYKIFTGPFKNLNDAEISLKNIQSNKSWTENTSIIKR